MLRMRASLPAKPPGNLQKVWLALLSWNARGELAKLLHPYAAEMHRLRSAREAH